MFSPMALFMHAKTVTKRRSVTRDELIDALEADGETHDKAVFYANIFEGLGADEVLVGNEKLSLKRGGAA